MDNGPLIPELYLSPLAAFTNPTTTSTDNDDIPILPPMNPPPSKTSPELSEDKRQFPEWETHGIDLNGSRLFLVPTFALGKPPLRIDVYITSPSQDSILYVDNQHRYLKALGEDAYGTYFASMLGLWSRGNMDLERRYLEMPFASRIVITEPWIDQGTKGIYLEDNHDVENAMLSVSHLFDLWNLTLEDRGRDRGPKVIDLGRLKLEKTIHEAICLVTISAGGTDQDKDDTVYVFKSTTREQGVKYLYHEIKTLLTLPPHPHIAPQPLFLVTKKCGFGGKRGVCGFVMEYYEYGHLGANLLRFRQADAKSTGRACGNFSYEPWKWASQLVDAVLHITSGAMGTGGFYSDLKLDNIMLVPSSSPEGGRLDIKLIDFEQRGAWWAWSPPETYLVELLEFIVNNPAHAPAEVVSRYKVLLSDYFGQGKLEGESWTYTLPLNQISYTNPEHGFSTSWLALTAQEREKAMVFMLGKILWCLFEVMPSINSSVFFGRQIFREVDPQKRFPVFSDRTPEGMRALIRECTRGAPEWEGEGPYVIWNDSKIDVEVKQSKGVLDDEQSSLLTSGIQVAAKDYWRKKLAMAEDFITKKQKIDIESESGRKNGYHYDFCRVRGAAAARPDVAEVQRILAKLNKNN